ncbi:MAG: hypothetical protein AABX70_03625 [Nanoarchaeota archaeon]
MYQSLLKWDIYEISAQTSSLHGVKLRGRIRKFGIDHQRNILAENTQDQENQVRFAVPTGENVSDLETFLLGVVPDCSVKQVMVGVENPVLSKLLVNQVDRYQL